MTLRPGQHLAFSGHFLSARSALAARAERAGLHVDPEVSATTDVLVANDAGSGSTAVRAAIARGIPLLDEYTFDEMLSSTPVG
jgi:NAD-dependent DNA ligase